MQSVVFINKQTGEPKTSLNIMEMSQYRKATPDEQASYYKATEGQTPEMVEHTLKKIFAD